MSSFHPTHTTSTQSPEEILKRYPNASYIIVNDHHHNKITRPAINMARPTTDILYAPLSRLSVTPEELEEMRQRSASPSRYKGHSYPIDAIPPTRRLWRCLSGCRLPRGYVVQRAILAACLFTTLITWSGLLRNGHQKINNMMAGDKKTAWGECSRHNHSVEYGHTNPCWRLGVPADCQGLCEGQLVCAPKTIFAGVDGCYDSEMLMPLGFQHGILMLEEKINFRDECPIEYLQRNYGEVTQAMEDTEKSKEPVFFTNDEHFLTTLVPNGVAVGSRFHTEMTRISYWLRPKASNVVVFLCDPTHRLLKHINESLVLIEPTKQAVHKYLVIRLEKAKKCLERYDIVKCQQMDKGEDQLYSHILAGIYLPYMVELQKYMPSNTVKLAYSDKLNASSYMPMIKTLARSLQVNVNYQKLKTVVEKRFEAARSMSKLINNIHPATLFAIKQFYEPHLDDTRRIFSLFS